MTDYNYVQIISDDDWGLLEIAPQNKRKNPLIKEEEPKNIKKTLIKFCDPEEDLPPPKPKNRIIGKQMGYKQHMLVGFR